MPTYCDVVIAGPEHEVLRLKQQVATPYATHFADEAGTVVPGLMTGDFLLWNCARPTGEDLLTYWGPTGAGKPVASPIGRYANSCWDIAWNFDNWGVGEDLGREHPDCLVEHSPGRLAYRFELGWSENPERAIRALSAQFPDLEVTLTSKTVPPDPRDGWEVSRTQYRAGIVAGEEHWSGEWEEES